MATPTKEERNNDTKTKMMILNPRRKYNSSSFVGEVRVLSVKASNQSLLIGNLVRSLKMR